MDDILNVFPYIWEECELPEIDRLNSEAILKKFGAEPGQTIKKETVTNIFNDFFTTKLGEMKK